MVISHKHKFIFFHAEKCAGTFIEKRLCEVLEEPEWKTAWASPDWGNGVGKNLEGQYIKHMRPSQLKALWKGRFADYETWTSVRDPWGQYISLYYMMTQWPKYASIEGFHAKKHGRVHGMNDYKSFNEFIRCASLGIGPKGAVGLFDRFKNYNTQFAEGLIQNYIRFDKMQDGLNEFCRRYGLSRIDANNKKTHVADNGETYDCTSRHGTIDEEYDNHGFLTVQQTCKQDINKFGFSKVLGDGRFCA